MLGDLTRTLCVGEPPEELVEWHQQVRELSAVLLRPSGRESAAQSSIRSRWIVSRSMVTRRGRAAWRSKTASRTISATVSAWIFTKLRPSTKEARC